MNCPNCGRENSPDAKLCDQCGYLFSEDDSADQLTSLQAAAPRKLQRKIHDTHLENTGERKPVTILFADIVGSTSIAEKLDPEEWKEVVNGAHRRVGEAIYRYEGTIAQLLGDGVLAFFGAPITHEDDPVRAVHAALDIQDAIRVYEGELEDLVDQFQMRIGINTGEVVIGDIGTDMHMEYLAIGDAVNVAARLQSAAEPGKVVLSELSAKLVSTEFELNDLGAITVKGKGKSLQAFELMSLKVDPERVSGLPTTYVGRERQVEELQSALLALCDGHGQIVTVMGDAGIGKTRLLEEVKALTCGDDADSEEPPNTAASIHWLEGRALSYGETLSYWTITQLLLDDLGLSDGAPRVKIKVALWKRVRTMFGEVKSEEVLPNLAHLLGLNVEPKTDNRIQSLDGATLKKQTLKSVSDYIAQIAVERPTVLVFEDLHWADPSSLEALEHLLPLTDHGSLMILMLMRIDRDHGSWGVKFKAETDFPHRTTEIHLRRLSEQDSFNLLEKLLGETKLPEEIWRTIMERSEGNPFYLEEVVRHLMERDLIVQGKDGWRAAEELGEIGILDTLQGVLLARIDRLEKDVQLTLQMASVIGKSFLYRILEMISEAELQLDQHLSQLQRVDLVREKARIPELEYVFKHALTQEAAYKSLLHERRRKFHLRVGEALEELFDVRREEFYGLLAHHFEAAEAHEKALNYLVHAGDQARLAYAHQEAIDYYRRALVFMKEQEDYESSARTLMKLGLTFHNAFDFQQARHAIDESFAMRQQVKESHPPDLPPAPHPFRVVGREPLTLDPTISNDTASGFYIWKIFSGLILFGSRWEVIPEVAQSWEVSEDGLRYVFHLRNDVFWGDGTQVTAEDFVYAILRTLTPSTHAPPGTARLWYDIKGARAYHMGEVSDPDQVGVRAIDALTLEVELERPASHFLQVSAYLFPVPRHVVEAHGDAWTDIDNIVTNGPFQLESYKAGEGITLARNPSYHGRFSGNLQRVEVNLSVLSGSEDELKLYESGSIDVASLEEVTYHARRDHVNEYISEPFPGTYYVRFDTSRPPFDDARVRQAFVMAVDRERLADKVIGGFLHPATGGFVSPGVPGHSPGIGLPYDPAKARQLLTQAVYPEGRDFPKLKLVRYLELDWIEHLKAEWLDNLSVEITFNKTNRADFTQNIRQWHISLMGWVADYPDPDNFLRVGVQSLGFTWRNDVYERLLEEAQRSSKLNERIRLYQEADKILIEEAVIMPIAHARRHSLVKPWLKMPVEGINLWTLKDVIIEPH